ncbi:glycine C-acetyltransferase [Dysgonomonas alginatilytica]|uniref:Glycine C-acetyltransferase n=1 Tax=Dysgonomonas alginatilytica TaxID=1605892 RepID=A0A2V3PN02_9BACT|nr:aminotransferase class I/II-fold pyridoxal phosphate-dependent enzyme [Dysgonomonas alginatilytica]PXV62359.1 glycine C-acetyltransferase [Dysgonomonas alginatilytica]
MKEEELYSIKDTNISLDMDIYQRAELFNQLWINQCKENKHLIYWVESNSRISSRMNIFDINEGLFKDVVSFVANDYLGMSGRDETIAAGIEAMRKYGTGACAAPVIGGYLDIHKKLELKIANFVGQEDSLIFSSGFGANTGVLNCLLGKNDIALIDSFVHTSVLDGLKGTNIKNIGHNDMEYLEMTLKNVQNLYTTKLVVVDGVYSQDGDLGLLPEISTLCKRYSAFLMVDDAHGIGVMGENGRGTLEYYNMLGEVDIVTGTFSKSFGCVGGFAATSKELVQYLRYYANTTMFSASVTPQVTASVIKAIELIEEDPSIRKRLWDNVEYLKSKLDEEGFDYKETKSPIFPIMIRHNFKAKEVAALLLKEGIYTNAICYPAVRNREARIRVGILATHKKSDINILLSALVKINKTIQFT